MTGNEQEVRKRWMNRK